MNEATGDGGTCYGDSDGPHFLGSVVVSVTVTGDVWCKATDKTYRVDTKPARERRQTRQSSEPQRARSPANRPKSG